MKTIAAVAFKALVERLTAEDRFFHMEDNITAFDMFTADEQAEFGAIIEAARNELTAEEFDAIAFGDEEE